MLALVAKSKTNTGTAAIPIFLSHSIGVALGSLHKPGARLRCDNNLGLCTIDRHDTRHVNGTHREGLDTRGEVQSPLGILPTLCRSNGAREGDMLGDDAGAIQMAKICHRIANRDSHFRTDLGNHGSGLNLGTLARIDLLGKNDPLAILGRAKIGEDRMTTFGTLFAGHFSLLAHSLHRLLGICAECQGQNYRVKSIASVSQNLSIFMSICMQTLSLTFVCTESHIFQLIRWNFSVSGF